MNKRKPTPNWDILDKYFEYDETSPSCLKWKVRKANRIHIGDVAGWKSYHPKGKYYYWIVEFNNKPYKVHNLIWMLLMHEDVPENMSINHIDNDTENNKIENLKPESQSIQVYNQRLQTSNSSGARGVQWCMSNKKWQAWVSVNGKKKYLGQSDNIRDVIIIRINYMIQNHPEISYKNEIIDLKKNFPDIYLELFPNI